MRFFFLRNLRFRLITSLCFAIAPLVIIGSFILVRQYQASTERVQQDTFRLMRMAESEYCQLLERSRQFLVLLSHHPAVAGQDVSASNTLFAEMKKHYPHFTNISTAKPSGERIASALPVQNPDSVKDRSWYPRILGTRDFVIGDYGIGAISRKPNFDVAYPAYDAEGGLKVILFAGLDLNWFQELAASMDLPAGWVLTIRDVRGAILTRYPDGERWVGKTAADAPVARAIIEGEKGGVAKAAGVDGVERLYAFANLNASGDGRGLYLSIGVPLDVAYAEVRQNLIVWVACLVLVIVLAFSGMAVGSHLFILPNVKTLTDATKQLCAGNLSVRTGLPYGGGELGELAEAFDRMAETLELRGEERERSRKALLESEHKFRTIFNSVNDAILVLDPATGAILDANQRLCELSGYTREQVKGFGPAELSSGEAPYRGEEAVKWLVKAKTEGPQVFEWHAKDKAGRLFWMEANLRAAVIGGKDVVVLTARDTTKRKKAEIALRESESRYRAFIENSSEGIFRIELERPIPIALPEDDLIEEFYSSAYLAECNDEMAHIYGLEKAEDIIGSRMSEFLPRTDAHNVEYLAAFVRSGYRLVEAESYRKDMNGQEIRFSSSLIGEVEDGRLLRAWGVQREITLQKQAEENLRNLYRFNNEIISSARNGILVYDMNFNYVLWNRFMEEMTGLAAASILGKNALEEFPHMREQGVDKLIRRAMAGESCQSGDINFVVPHTGKEVWMIANYGPHYNTRGEIIGVIAIVTDITGRKTSEAEVERLGRRNQLILNAAEDGIIGLDTKGGCVFANPASAGMLGYEIDEMIGRDIHQLIHHHKADGSSYPATECPMSKTLADGIRCRIRDEVLWTKDGGSFPAVYSSTPIVENGEVTGAVLTFRDVTARRKAEEARKNLRDQLRQAQKMEAIGTLAGGIAHDFNNILTPILGYCELCLHEVENNSSLYRKIDQVLKSSLRAKDLVSQILAFSRKNELELRPVQVSLIVKEALNFLRSSLPSTIIIRRQVDPDALQGRVLADPTRIHQIMINLCTNAAHAIGEKGGTLGVSLGLHEIESIGDRRHSDLAPGDYLMLSVSDTGCGIDEELQQRIFEPYFTTKGSGEGTGLGLAMVYGIVKGLGGSVSVTSKPGQGATFDILLPLARAPVETMVEVAPVLPVGSGRILLVDDEPAVVDLQKEMLEHLGYEATVRYSSLDALEAFRANPKKFDLILTDQTMPQMTGVELAREALKICPGIPIILCTGFSESIDEPRARAEGIKGFLMKPLLLHEMAAAIRRVLEADELRD
ncbi:MAG: PAS domain S-box protein [Syntrophobacteraceae bacterium]